MKTAPASVFKTPHDPSIDALRGIAVMMVFFHHLYIPSVGVGFYDAFLTFFKDFGTYGVDLFFVISGYCIHGAYSKKEAPFSTKNYLLRRWWRIYPPYFFALALAVFLNLATNYYKLRSGGNITNANFGATQILSHVFLVHNLSSATLLSVSGPFWTIAIEAQFYILYLFFRPYFYSARGWLGVLIVSGVLHFTAWGLYQQHPTIEWLMPFRYWLEWVLGAFLVYLKWTPKRLFFFPTRVLAKIGSFSFSIYLVHFLFMDRIRVFILPKLTEGLPRLAGSLSTGLFCLAVSYGFFVLFEKPFLNKAASIPKYRT